MVESKFIDNRGMLLFPIKSNSNNFIVKECSVSINKKFVFRGIHINSFSKLVTCVSGKILDILINFNENAIDYLTPQYYVLDPQTSQYQIHVPPNYGHAFLSLQNDSILLYHLEGIFTNENTKHINYREPRINIDLSNYLNDNDWVNKLILSKNDKICNFINPIEFMIIGASGYLGSCITEILHSNKYTYIICNSRLEDIVDIENFIKAYNPRRIINCAGITGNPNILWCDENKCQTIQTNLTYQLSLVHICNKYGIHLTILGSGGIFRNDKVYGESDEGNFDFNFYSKTKIVLENMVKCYDNVFYVRVNYPIGSTCSPKNLLCKLLGFKHISDVDVSITPIDDLFPILIEMIRKNHTGICNLVHPEIINLPKIMEIYNLYEEHLYLIQPLSVSDNRSYAKLNTDRLNHFTTVNCLEDTIRNCIKKYIENKK
jgi:3,5-epimerase/4-reductase